MKWLCCSPRRSAYMGGRRTKFSSAEAAKPHEGAALLAPPQRAHGRSAAEVFERTTGQHMKEMHCSSRRSAHMGGRRTEFSSAEAAKRMKGLCCSPPPGRAHGRSADGVFECIAGQRMKALRCSPSPGRAHGRSAAEVFERPASQCASKPREGAALLAPPQRVHGRSADGVFERPASQYTFKPRMKALRCSPSPGRVHGQSAAEVFERAMRETRLFTA